LFNFPTLTTLSANWLSAFRSRGALDAATPFNNVVVASQVMAGGQAEDFGRLDFVGRQAFAVTAEGTWLDTLAGQYGLTRRPAGGAGGDVLVTTTGAASFPAGCAFIRADGWTYASMAAASLPVAGSISIPVAAVSNPQLNPGSTTDGTGSAGNCAPGTPLTVGPQATGPGILGATAQADIGGIVNGMDVEQDGAFYTTDLSTLRGRLLFRLRNPPAGGNPADYVQWCTDIPGVTRVFVERRWRGAGSVRVFPLFSGLFPGGSPDAAHLAEVASYLEGVVPATALVTTAAAALYPIDVTIANLNPPTAAVQAAVIAELQNAFLRLSRVSGSDLNIPALPYLAWPFTFSASWIWQAVANASGSQSFDLTAPAADEAIPDGAIPVLGSVFFE
jgi:uncharacterized phage protein gp47/JayE